MRMPIRRLNGLGAKFLGIEVNDCAAGEVPQYDATGDTCCLLDQEMGLCTPVLTTATGAPVANLNPPAPPAGATSYSLDYMAGQMTGAATEQNAQNAAAAAQAGGAAAGGGTPAATPPTPTCSGTNTVFGCIATGDWVLLGIAVTLGLILTVKS